MAPKTIARGPMCTECYLHDQKQKPNCGRRRHAYIYIYIYIYVYIHMRVCMPHVYTLLSTNWLEAEFPTQHPEVQALYRCARKAEPAALRASQAKKLTKNKGLLKPGLYRGYIGIMEKKMETLGPFKRVYRGYMAISEQQGFEASRCQTSIDVLLPSVLQTLHDSRSCGPYCYHYS